MELIICGSAVSSAGQRLTARSTTEQINYSLSADPIIRESIFIEDCFSMNLLNEFSNRLLVDLFSRYEFRNPFFDFLLLIANDAMKMHFLFVIGCVGWKTL